MVNPDPRLRLVQKHNLQIHNIRPQDAGDYTCKISLLGEKISITHTLEILGKSDISASYRVFKTVFGQVPEKRYLSTSTKYSSKKVLKYKN